MRNFSSGWKSLFQSFLFLWASLVFLQNLQLVQGATDPGIPIDRIGQLLGSTGELHTAPSILAVIAILAGTLLCFYGYKLYRPTIFLCGFIVGGLLVALIIRYAFPNMTWVGTASWIGFVCGGFIMGCLVLWFYAFGVSLVGVAAGVLLAFTLNTSFGYKIYPTNPDVVLVVLIVLLALVGGLLAWMLERFVIVIATSFVGGVAMVWGAGYFIGHYPSGADLKRYRVGDPNGDWIYSIPSAWWGYLAATIVFFLLGVYIQFSKTGKGVHHSKASRAIGRRSSVPQEHDENDDPFASVSTPRQHV